MLKDSEIIDTLYRLVRFNIRQNKFLVFFDEKTSENVLKILKKLSEKFCETVYLLEVEKSYDNLRKSGLKHAEDLAKKIEKFGFDQVYIDYMGYHSEMEYVKDKNPDFVIDLCF